MDYIVAFYPFVLILLTYMLVTMYDRHYRILVWMWKPFKWCSQYYLREWKIGTSLMEIFASFIQLSYVKILGTCFNIVFTVRTYDINGNRLKEHYLYYDANIEYFGRQHLPFAILALFTGLVLVVLPFLLLVLYPCRCFQRGLNYMGWRCQTLHIFMDAFQGSYKIEPYDFRFFSAYYMLLRGMILVQVTIFPSIFFFYTSAMILIVSAALILIIQPYKVNAHNKIDAMLMLMLATYFVSFHEGVLLSSLVYCSESVTAQGVTKVSTILFMASFISLVFWRLLGLKLKQVISRMCCCIANIHRRSSYLSMRSSERELLAS